MEEKDLKSVPGEVDDMTPDYIAAINELKQNSVDKAKYDALRLENKKLLDAVVNGQTVEVQASKPEVNIQDLRNKLFNTEEQTNLANVTLKSNPNPTQIKMWHCQLVIKSSYLFARI